MPKRLKLDANGFEFLLEGPVGYEYVIEKSTNLLTWDVLWTGTPTNTPWLIRDPEATTVGSAFYRARLLP